MTLSTMEVWNSKMVEFAQAQPQVALVPKHPVSTPVDLPSSFLSSITLT